MTNMKKILLASAILATSPMASAGELKEFTSSRTVENDGEINLYGSRSIKLTDGAWIENYGVINCIRASAENKITFDDGDTGIRNHMDREFRPMTDMLPTQLVLNQDNALIKDAYADLSQRQYHSLMSESGRIIVKTGGDDPEVLTKDSYLADYFEGIGEGQCNVEFVESENGDRSLYNFLSNVENNVEKNVIVLRGTTENVSISLNNENTAHAADNPFVVKTAIANNGTYLSDFITKLPPEQTPPQTKTLDKVQNLEVNGNFNFQAGNELFTDGKVTFLGGTSVISSVNSMFKSNIDVNDGATLILNPQCERYYNDQQVNTGNTTITLDKTVNVKSGGNITLSNGKLVIGSTGVLNLGAE